MNAQFTSPVPLVGDAAWCASPLSGLGTALGLRGSAELAAALRRHDVSSPTSHRTATALSAFEAAMRPIASAAQRLLPGRVSMIAPRTHLSIQANARLMRVLQAPVLLPLVELLASGRGH